MNNFQQLKKTGALLLGLAKSIHFNYPIFWFMAELLSVIILSALAHQPSEQQPRFTNSAFNINNNK